MKIDFFLVNSKKYMEIKTHAVYLKLASRESNYTYQPYSSKH